MVYGVWCMVYGVWCMAYMRATTVVVPGTVHCRVPGCSSFLIYSYQVLLVVVHNTPVLGVLLHFSRLGFRDADLEFLRSITVRIQKLSDLAEYYWYCPRRILYTRTRSTSCRTRYMYLYQKPQHAKTSCDTFSHTSTFTSSHSASRVPTVLGATSRREKGVI
jgi:hypothetical protein